MRRKRRMRRRDELSASELNAGLGFPCRLLCRAAASAAGAMLRQAVLATQRQAARRAARPRYWCSGRGAERRKQRDRDDRSATSTSISVNRRVYRGAGTPSGFLQPPALAASPTGDAATAARLVPRDNSTVNTSGGRRGEYQAHAAAAGSRPAGPRPPCPAAAFAPRNRSSSRISATARPLAIPGHAQTGSRLVGGRMRWRVPLRRDSAAARCKLVLRTGARL